MANKKKTLQPAKEVILLEQQLLEEFNENPLSNLLGVTLQEHIGTEREQKTALTALLYILRIMALKDRSGILKITGKSSAGKSHLLKTLLQLFPKKWIKEIGDASGKALRYVEWKQERILVIKEAAGGESSTETLKLMDSGDGGFKFLVTRGTVADGFYAEEISVPIKFIVTTSAKDIFDNELDNRMFGVSIDESDMQTFLVLLHRCKEFAGHLPKAYYGIAIKFISELQEYDEIKIPFSYEFLNIVNRNIRARRDIDKLLSLCQTSAFINQQNRPSIEKDGKKILFTHPEDAYNVFTIAFSSFEETTTGLTSRMEQIYNAIPQGAEVTYRDIMRTTKINYKMQIKREVEKLEDLGLVDISTSSNKHTITRLDDIKRMKKDFEQHKMNFLIYTMLDLAINHCDCEIPLYWIDINDEINRNKKCNKVSQEYVSPQENRNKKYNKTVTKPKIFYKNEELEQYFGDGKNVEIVTNCYGHVTVNVTVSQQEKNGLNTVKCNTVTEHTEQSKNRVFIDLNIDEDSYASCYDVTPQFFDQKNDMKKLKHFVKVDSDNCFNWDNDLNNFIKTELEKQDPDFWINKNIEIGILEEPILGKLRFLHDFGGIS